MFIPCGIFAKDGKIHKEILRDANVDTKEVGSTWSVVRNGC